MITHPTSNHITPSTIPGRDCGDERDTEATVFKGRYDPDGAQTWLREIERIFRVMDCAEAQKVRL
ncbi:cellular nucleic acid-binding protein, partial [Trifolium medium]|nr:cellular nucleic acid-binding protein [Trifolium medium]